MKITESLLLKSKHSQYQSIHPEVLKKLEKNLDYKFNKKDFARAEYFLKQIDYKQKTFCDIGANTGYFSFEAIAQGALRADAYEGNPVHAKFIESATQLIPEAKNISIFSEYFDFERNQKKYDILFCLNVLHHIGDDFYNSFKDVEKAKEKISEIILKMCHQSETLVLQLGFNWKGNRETPLFSTGTKKEIIDFVDKSIPKTSELIIALFDDKTDTYVSLSKERIELLNRKNNIGEFLNRPMFIVKNNEP